MDSLKVKSNAKRIAINDDPNRVILFNPSDVGFAERFYKLMEEFDTKISEFQDRIKNLESDNDTGEGTMPANFGARVEVYKEVCLYFFEKIDLLFGVGTSEKVFSGEMDPDMILQFLEGIVPFIESARVEKINKYKADQSGRVMR